MPWLENDTSGVSFLFSEPLSPLTKPEGVGAASAGLYETHMSSLFFAEKRPSHSSPENRPVLEELQL